MSKPRTRRPRTAECTEVTMLLRGQGLECEDAAAPDQNPEPEERPEYEAEMLVVAAYCGPCVGLYSARSQPRTARADVP